MRSVKGFATRSCNETRHNLREADSSQQLELTASTCKRGGKTRVGGGTKESESQEEIDMSLPEDTDMAEGSRRREGVKGEKTKK